MNPAALMDRLARLGARVRLTVKPARGDLKVAWGHDLRGYSIACPANCQNQDLATPLPFSLNQGLALSPSHDRER